MDATGRLSNEKRGTVGNNTSISQHNHDTPKPAEAKLRSQIIQFVFLSDYDIVDVGSALETYLDNNPLDYQHFQIGGTRMLRAVTGLPPQMARHFMEHRREPIFNPGAKSNYSNTEKETLRRGMLHVLNGARLLDEADSMYQLRNRGK